MKTQNAIKSLLAVAIVTIGVYVASIGAFAQGTCKVSESAAKIRATASTSAEVVGSTTRGTKLDVISSTKDSSGYTWYKVYVENQKTGYIRGDLVTDVSGDIPSESGDTSSSTTSEASTTTVDPCQYTSGKVKDTVNVRESASASSNKKTVASAGKTVNITGQAKDSDGKIWYQVNIDGTTGFIRSDFIDTSDSSASNTTEATDADAATDEPVDDGEVVDDAAPAEEPEDDWGDLDTSSTPVNNDYELRYEANDEGTEMWYLYDHVKGTRQSLDNIFAVMQQSQNMQVSNDSADSKMKIIVIVMGVVILVLIIVITILIFKLRDSYEDWEDDDDDEEEEEEEKPVVSRREKAQPAKKSRFIPDDDEELDDEDIKIVNKRGREPIRNVSTLTKPSRTVQEDRKEAWQSKQFFDMDDDMEFEFLDIDK